MKLSLAVLFCLTSLPLALGEDCPAILKTPTKEKAFGELRVKAIKGWDTLITWALAPQNKPPILISPPEKKAYKREGTSLQEFDKNYGYFSLYHPIVGTVTELERDIQATKCLLQEMGSEINSLEELHFASHEVLSKVLAYRPLKKGMKISISVTKTTKYTYIVDEVINLWRGMPAFGLVPERKNGVAPILLFRGTDLDLTSEKGWASVLSDLDVRGPGHDTFLRAQRQIHNWLKKVKNEYGPARAMGFSLGGVFVLYTMIYEHGLLNKTEKSIAFNAPGISEEVLKKWEALKEREKTPHIIYMNRGDMVSQLGFFLSDVWEISLQEPMGVIESHVTLISAQPYYTFSKVNVAAEHAKRR